MRAWQLQKQHVSIPAKSCGPGAGTHLLHQLLLRGAADVQQLALRLGAGVHRALVARLPEVVAVALDALVVAEEGVVVRRRACVICMA
jgi:hypothetical protein